MGTRRKKSSAGFLMQGSILAVASIISRIIGLVYRVPLNNIIGDTGNDYYTTAFEIYNILLIISSYSLPLAVSKLVSANLSQGRRRNIYRILKCALLFGAVTGTAAAAILYFGADFITNVIMKTPYSIFAVRVLVPVLLIVAVLGVIRGFFQGLGTMMPSAVSQILEQIANAVVSVWAAYVLYAPGMKIGAVLGNKEQYAAAYGASGGTLGTGVGALVGLLFVIFVLIIYLKVFRRQMKKERRGTEDTYREILRVLIATISPVLLSTTIYNCNALLDQALYKNIAAFQGYTAEQYGVWNGIYGMKYKTLLNVPLSIASAMAASCVPSLTAAYSSGDIKQVKTEINMATRFISVISFPCAVGMGVLASPILQLLFSDSTQIAAQMLQVGAVSVIFFSLSTLSNGLLQGINRMKEPVKNAAVALVLHLIVLAVLMFAFDLNIFAVVIANASFGLLMCLFNARSLYKYSRYRQEIKKTFLVPGVSAAVMGVAVWGCYTLLMMALPNNAVATLISITVGIIVYVVLLFLLKGMTEHELLKFPKGKALVRIAKRFHLLRK